MYCNGVFTVNGYNILVVDDEPEIIELIEIYLKNEGYIVYKAVNGQDCIALLHGQATIHLVILDIMLPGMDDIEVKDIVIYKENYTVNRNGREVTLTPKEYEILLLLASNGGKVFGAGSSL